jgi:hypothetical protein
VLGGFSALMGIVAIFLAFNQSKQNNHSKATKKERMG